jgi:DNA-binding transcriptional LysR family regulator
LHRTKLILGDGLRAAMDALLAGLDIELQVETELNDHETIRLMVAEGAGAAVLPFSSVSRECARGLLAAHRITETGVFRTLALGVRASRNASLARDAAARTIRAMVEEMDDEGRLALIASRLTRRKLQAAS